jgi:hypothetical protein
MFVSSLCFVSAVAAGCSSPTSSEYGAQFSVTGEVTTNLIFPKGYDCATTAGGGIDGPSDASGYVTVAWNNDSPDAVAIQVPSRGGSFSFPNASAIVVVQLIGGVKVWAADTSLKTGSGTVKATANGESGSVDATLRADTGVTPVNRAPASRDVHVVGSWSGCPPPHS